MKYRNTIIFAELACLVATLSHAGISQAQDTGVAETGTATFTLATLTDSEKTLGRHYTVVRYVDDACTKVKKKSKIFRKKYAKDQHQFDVLEVNPGEPFIFQVDYSEKRRESERLCSASAGFTPIAGRAYKAIFEVSGQVSRCTISLFDLTEGEVAMEAEIVPEIMCTRKGATGNRNGVPSHSMVDRF